MLPAARRLRHRAEFSETVRHGRRAGARGLVIHLWSGDSAMPAQVGFVVGKVVGPAVVRNQVRRRLRHLMADRLDKLPAGSLVVVRASSTAATASHAELGAGLDRLLARVAPVSG